MLVGNDVSGYQGQIDWDIYCKNSNFAFPQATEGVGFTDSQFLRNQSEARRVGIPHGYYHLSYPLINQPQAEADYFLKTIGPIQNGEILWLDFEEGGTVAWAKAWLDYVSAKLGGYKPLIYLNLSEMNSYDWSSVANTGYGLILAQYNNQPGITDPIKYWNVLAFHQWTNAQAVPGINANVVDGMAFLGDATEFLAYGYDDPIVPTPPIDYKVLYTELYAKDETLKVGLKSIMETTDFAWVKTRKIAALIKQMGI